MMRHDDLYGRATPALEPPPLFAYRLAQGALLAAVAVMVLGIGLTIWAVEKTAKWAAILLPGLFHAGRKDW